MSAKPSKEELMKAVADVLDEAIVTFEKLEKMDGIDGAQVIADPSKAGQPGSVESQADGLQGQATAPEAKGSADVNADGVKGPKEAVLKDGDSKDEDDEKKKKDKKDEDDKDKDDEKSMFEAFKSMAAKLSEKGLLNKALGIAEPTATIQKSEAAPAPAAPASDTKIEELKKSFTDTIEGLTKKIGEISEKVEKIASSPAAPRRGLSGATPLRKSEEAQASQPRFSKLEALDKLVDLRKSGDQRVDTGLIARVELGKLAHGDVERLNSILG